MATITRDFWEDSEDWRSVVAHENHEQFLETLAASKREGKEVKRCIVIAGAPIVYDVSD